MKDTNIFSSAFIFVSLVIFSILDALGDFTNMKYTRTTKAWGAYFCIHDVSV